MIAWLELEHRSYPQQLLSSTPSIYQYHINQRGGTRLASSDLGFGCIKNWKVILSEFKDSLS